MQQTLVSYNLHYPLKNGSSHTCQCHSIQRNMSLTIKNKLGCVITNIICKFKWSHRMASTQFHCSVNIPCCSITWQYKGNSYKSLCLPPASFIPTQIPLSESTKFQNESSVFHLWDSNKHILLICITATNIISSNADDCRISQTFNLIFTDCITHCKCTQHSSNNTKIMKSEIKTTDQQEFKLISILPGQRLQDTSTAG